MRSPWGLLIGGAVLVVVGFFAGRASVRIDDRTLLDSLAVYRERLTVSAEARESLVVVIGDARRLVDSAEAGAAEDRQRANQRIEAADRAKFRADQILATLRTAKTAADTNRILGLACTEIRNECAELRGANADLTASLAKEAEAKGGLRTEIAAHVQTRTTDSTNLETGKRLIGQLEKQVRGCRLPIFDVPCPTLLVNYDLDDSAFHVGGGIPIKSWLTVSVTTRLSPGGKP